MKKHNKQRVKKRYQKKHIGNREYKLEKRTTILNYKPFVIILTVDILVFLTYFIFPRQVWGDYVAWMILPLGFMSVYLMNISQMQSSKPRKQNFD